MEINVIHIYADENGESHFEDLRIPLDGGKGEFRDSKTFPVTGLHFVELAKGLIVEPHNAPRRQFLIALEGDNEIETSDGEKRTIKPGEILWVEDTTGKGHITRWKDEHHTIISITMD